MLIDSHCHLDCLDLKPYDNQLTNVLAEAKQNGVEHILCVCIDLENFPSVLKIAEDHQGISASVGVHPNEDVKGNEPSADKLIELAQHLKIVAIGETGLDYYRNQGDMGWQQQRFREHIRAANTVKKPLIVHTREAREDTIAILREEQAHAGVLHCFTESLEMAEQALELGFYISFSGIVTFKNAKELQEVARKIPLEKLLVETDSPYLAPVPFRGKSNIPAYVKHVAEFVADLRGMSYKDLVAQTAENYQRLFGKVVSCLS